MSPRYQKMYVLGLMSLAFLLVIFKFSEATSLVVDGTTVTLCGLVTNYTDVSIINSGVINVCDYEGSPSNCDVPNTGVGCGYIDLQVDTFYIDASSDINGSGRGYEGGRSDGASGSGPGGGGGDATWNDGAGGGYGGAGGDGQITHPGPSGGSTYGNSTNVTNLGSGGGAGNSEDAGDGGGWVQINASTLIYINGTIDVSGTNAYAFSTNQQPGGGSGGGLRLISYSLAGVGNLFSRGGNGTAYFSADVGGGGGGGRIYITYCLNSSNYYVNVTGGPPGAPGIEAAAFGGNGTFEIRQDIKLCGASLMNITYPLNTSPLSVSPYSNITLYLDIKDMLGDNITSNLIWLNATSGNDLCPIIQTWYCDGTPNSCSIYINQTSCDSSGCNWTTSAVITSVRVRDNGVNAASASYNSFDSLSTVAYVALLTPLTDNDVVYGTEHYAKNFTGFTSVFEDDTGVGEATNYMYGAIPFGEFNLTTNTYLKCGNKSAASTTRNNISFNNPFPDLNYSTFCFPGGPDTDSPACRLGLNKNLTSFEIIQNDDAGGDELFEGGLDWCAISWGEYNFNIGTNLKVGLKETNGTGGLNIVYNTPFSDTNYSVFLSDAGGNISDACACHVLLRETTNFVGQCWDDGSVNCININISWMAISNGDYDLQPIFCSGYASGCGNFSNSESSCNNFGCTFNKEDQVWYTDGIGWRANITINGTTKTGLHNLTVFTRSGRIDLNDTELNSLSYSVTTTISFSLTLPSGGGTYFNSTDVPPGTSTLGLDFNVTQPTQAFVHACVKGVACQDNTTAIFQFKNTGDVNMTMALTINATLPTGIYMHADMSYTYGSYYNLTTSNQTIISNLGINNSTNVWLWASFVNQYAIQVNRELQSIGNQKV